MTVNASVARRRRRRALEIEHHIPVPAWVGDDPVVWKDDVVRFAAEVHMVGNHAATIALIVELPIECRHLHQTVKASECA